MYYYRVINKIRYTLNGYRTPQKTFNEAIRQLKQFGIVGFNTNFLRQYTTNYSKLHNKLRRCKIIIRERRGVYKIV